MHPTVPPSQALVANQNTKRKPGDGPNEETGTNHPGINPLDTTPQQVPGMNSLAAPPTTIASLAEENQILMKYL